MTTLIVGASGATGSLLVQQLLEKNETVKIIIRSASVLRERLPVEIIENSKLVITEADLLSLTNDELVAQVKDCHVVVSCLGHNLTLKGMFGHPRLLVTNAVQRLCLAISYCSPQNAPVKFILMNTTGNQNSLAGEKVSTLQSIIMSFIRVLLPPHNDNEKAAEYLQNHIRRQNNQIEWVVIRPDSLTDSPTVTEYDIYPSPIRSAIFDAGKTSRINVAHFMSQLGSNNELWDKWKSQMPVLYNTPSITRNRK
ncbi:NAD(P)-dependent oxidoreductase [Paraglaciecola sp. L3A3]|uniref:NAD(P)-dependent oxidoreductase n=1 Tax=Paraglaciecola sp. L3A3 TaxID=2686358 RepID=UPI00131DC995|nr:NAD(P)-binding oxidoreductase [Paraglaciecola sp. L3A3]